MVLAQGGTEKKPGQWRTGVREVPDISQGSVVTRRS